MKSDYISDLIIIALLCVGYIYINNRISEYQGETYLWKKLLGESEKKIIIEFKKKNILVESLFLLVFAVINISGDILNWLISIINIVILINNIYLRLATYIQMETALKQYGTGKRIMTIKKDEINVLVPESGKKIIVSFIEIMEIGTIKEYCWIRVINQLIFIRKENFVIGDIEDFKRFIKLNTLAGEDWSRVWKGRN